MKYFVVEGILNNSVEMGENTLKEHIAYSQKAIDSGWMLLTGLKSDSSGGLFVMKAESLETVESYLASEPMKLAGVQEYRVLEFAVHYFQPSASEWFKKII